MQHTQQRAWLLFSRWLAVVREATWAGKKWLWGDKASAWQTLQGDSQRPLSTVPSGRGWVLRAAQHHPPAPGSAHLAVAPCPRPCRSCTYRLKLGAVWGWRRQRNACSAAQRGPREPFGSPPGCRRRRWPPRPCCSSCSTYGRGTHLNFKRTPPSVHPSDSIVHLLKRGASCRPEGGSGRKWLGLDPLSRDSGISEETQDTTRS